MRRTIFLAIVLVGIAGIGGAQTKPTRPKAPRHQFVPSDLIVAVVQGTVESISGNMLQLRPASSLVGTRQVDISTATFENSDGLRISRQNLATGDRILVVVDPNAPKYAGPPNSKPGHARPMYVRLLPLKALVVERLSPSAPVRKVINSG